MCVCGACSTWLPRKPGKASSYPKRQIMLHFNGKQTFFMFSLMLVKLNILLPGLMIYSGGGAATRSETLWANRSDHSRGRWCISQLKAEPGSWGQDSSLPGPSPWRDLWWWQSYGGCPGEGLLRLPTQSWISLGFTSHIGVEELSALGEKDAGDEELLEHQWGLSASSDPLPSPGVPWWGYGKLYQVRPVCPGCESHGPLLFQRMAVDVGVSGQVSGVQGHLPSSHGITGEWDLCLQDLVAR